VLPTRFEESVQYQTARAKNLLPIERKKNSESRENRSRKVDASFDEKSDIALKRVDEWGVGEGGKYATDKLG